MTEPRAELVDLRLAEKRYVSTILSSDRLEALGAGNYYLLRLQNGILLPDAEWDVLAFILRTFPTNSLIVEIGCGWGQLLAMAAARDYTCVGIDVSRERLEGARYLGGIVDSDYPGAASRLDFRVGDFPFNWEAALQSSMAKGRQPVIGFFSNLGIGQTEEFCEVCVAELRRFDYVVMDLVRFFTDRISAEAQEAFLGKMRARGIQHLTDIHHRPGAYRFIALTVGDAEPPVLREVVGISSSAQPLIDLATSAVEPVRATVQVRTEPTTSPELERVLRITEDHTPANSHDIRLTHAGEIADGSYVLTGVLRARERRGVCIILHRQWRDNLRIKVKVDTGAAYLEQISGDTFRWGGVRVWMESDWVHLEADVDISGQPNGVGVSIHLVDHEGKYYYDGDGCSAIDVAVLRLHARPGKCPA